MHAPTGAQFEITHGGQRAVVTERGATLRTYELDGRAIVDGFAEDAMPGAGRGQQLLPWPNRIAGASYEFAGARHQLPISEPRTGCASHGLVRWEAWQVLEHAAERVTLGHRLLPRPGYPFALELQVEHALGAGGLRVTTTATNVGHQACPFGAGAHPYLLPTAVLVDDEVLAMPAATRLELDGRGIPIGAVPVAGTAYDFRAARPVGAVPLDDCFTDLAADEDGLVRITLGATTLWADSSYPYVMLFTGDGRADIARRSIAIEPMSCAPDAFNSGDGLLVLEPGDTFAGSWGLRAG